MGFGDRLAERVATLAAPACVGIDPFGDRVPGVRPGMTAEEVADAVQRFGVQVVEAVAGLVPVIKPQSALFERWGPPGVAALARVVASARSAGLLVLVDGKRGDIGSTAEAYAVATLDDDGPLGADAATVSPYLGPESLVPWERRVAVGKGLFVLVRTSNPGAGAWQLDTGVADLVADWVASRSPGPGPGSVGAVVAATLPAEEVAGLRARMLHAWFLVPGFGAQGAGPEQVRPHFRADGTGALISSSREVCFPPSGFDDQPVDAIRERARTFVAATRLSSGIASR